MKTSNFEKEIKIILNDYNNKDINKWDDLPIVDQLNIKEIIFEDAEEFNNFYNFVIADKDRILSCLIESLYREYFGRPVLKNSDQILETILENYCECRITKIIKKYNS